MKDKNKNIDVNQKAEQPFAYYSKLLKEVFDTIDELNEAEEAYYAKQKAKEDKAATKKADALKVEEAFKFLNAARKEYKEKLNELTESYTAQLTELKESFTKSKKIIEENLAYAESKYSNELKAFTEKYPEGYHITLKDGDFETTISHETKGGNLVSSLPDMFELLHNFW